MRKLLLAFIIFTMLPNVLAAQQSVRKNLKGKVSADSDDLDGIYVVNLQTEDAVSTQSGGYFSIPVQAGDSLMLSSIQFKGIKIIIKEEDLSKELLFIRMQPLMYQIQEVKVFQYKNINAVALGIIPKGIKSYTPTERKLNAASNPYYTGLSVSVDPLLNFFSGRTAMLKKELIVEGKEFQLRKIENMFEQEYFINKLKIPAEYVKGFHYFLVENNRFVAVLKANNKGLATFMMGELAVKYLGIIACEKE